MALSSKNDPSVSKLFVRISRTHSEGSGKVQFLAPSHFSGPKHIFFKESFRSNWLI
jgi:hypothetical protein